jgi:hypothetical protein
MILNALTILHVALSLIAIGSGGVAIYGLLEAKAPGRWTQVFLSTTAATSITGFLFPFHGFTPAQFNVFVLVVQLFRRVPALKAVARTQPEPPDSAARRAAAVQGASK